MHKFQISNKYLPCGDQPQAIKKLTEGIEDGLRTQVLLGVTGSGKTFTMANVINNINRPTLVIAHNKTLAAQLCNEFRELFPNNRVEYFVSYYDYYKPEAYIPSTDTYIAKDLSLNEEIDKLRHSATASLGERNDVIVVASVSCIFGLGAPEEYFKKMISLRPNTIVDRDALVDRLVHLQYKRNDFDFARSTFRIRGDIIEVFPSNSSNIAIRADFFGDTLEELSEIDTTTSRVINKLEHVAIFPASHYIVGEEKLEEILDRIRNDMHKQAEYFKKNDKLIEAQRITERVNYDIEMIREIGYCNGIENYSRYFDGRQPKEPPFTLLDYFPEDFLLFIDESHMTLPQIRAMYNGDKARKDSLVSYGFRLPAAYDNRPLNFDEFINRFSQMICVSATPGPYEMSEQSQIVEQLLRPTGLIDPEVIVKKTEGQIDDLITEIYKSIEKNGRILITTLTKRMAESLTSYLKEHKIKVSYLHSDIDTLERIDIISSLRRGEVDVIVGINLLREGLDLPEVMLVAILDADKEGFLRSRSSLIQTIGRAARNSQAKVIMYADNITDSMSAAINETNRRREYQTVYNKKHNIIPQTISKEIKNTLMISKKVDDKEVESMSRSDIIKEIKDLNLLMEEAINELDFETCIELRDRINLLKKKVGKKKRK